MVKFYRINVAIDALKPATIALLRAMVAGFLGQSFKNDWPRKLLLETYDALSNRL